MPLMKRFATISIVAFIVAFFAHPAFAQEPMTHTVRPGESLSRIAQDYNIDLNDLAVANDIVYTWRILAGDTLVIPGRSTQASNVTNTQYHTVGYGEGLASIARRYGISLSEISSLNNITNPNLIYVGQRLIISGNTNPPAETIVEVEIPATTQNSAPITPGFSVVMPPAQTSSPAETTVSGERHVVRAGESLSGIANRFGVSLLALSQANNIYNPDHITVGQALIIPARTTTTTSNSGVVSIAAAPPARLTIGREIIVDLSDQRIYAYENGVLVRNVLVSTGLPATPTVRGDFTIQRKYRAQRMVGPGYDLPNVPYVAYFYAGYALHGTYWHENFGQPMSHGCVNLPTPEAEWFFNWAEIGTPIRVQL